MEPREDGQVHESLTSRGPGRPQKLAWLWPWQPSAQKRRTVWEMGGACVLCHQKNQRKLVSNPSYHGIAPILHLLMI